MTTVARKEVRCALCGKQSHCDVIGSWNDFGEQDTELRQYAVGMDPLDLFVVNCPHCGYVAYDLETELQSDRLEEIRQLVAAFHADKIRKNGDLPIHERYGLLAQIQQTLPESDEVIAETFLRAAWKADDLSQDGPATHYRQQAAIYLKGMLVSCPDESEKMAMQLKLSEVYRRSGEFEPALQLLKSIEADNAVPMLGMLVSALKRLSESKDRRQHFFKELLESSTEKRSCLDSVDRGQLLEAIKGEQVELVKELLTAGALDRDFRDITRGCMLEEAVKLNNVMIVRALLDAGVSPNERNWCGYHPLIRACEEESKEAAEELLKQGARIYRTDRLHSGCQYIWTITTKSNRRSRLVYERILFEARRKRRT